MKVFTNILLYRESNGNYCITYKAQDLPIADLAKPVLTTVNPNGSCTIKIKDINEANTFLQVIYPCLHPNAKVTNITKLFKSQKLANQQSDIEYRYFFRPEFKRVLNSNVGEIEWDIETKDLKQEYKEIFGHELHFYHEQFAKQIEKERKKLAVTAKKEQKHTEKHLKQIRKKRGKADKILLHCLWRGAKSLGYIR